VVKKALAALLSASIALSTPWAQAQVRLPSLGDSASEDLPVGAERRLGGQIMAEIKRDPAYLDDPLLLDYVRSLWRPLLEAARERGDIGAELDQAFSWEIFLVQDRSVNAFALPGGYVGVHLGLMAVTATRDELAAVLAHELSHVSQRHIAGVHLLSDEAIARAQQRMWSQWRLAVEPAAALPLLARSRPRQKTPAPGPTSASWPT
jgi:predicted Zn-dependent protease